jgi:hypothetical protein
MPDVSHAQCIAELLRVHLRSRDVYSRLVDGDALRVLTSHEPPLVELGPTSSRMLTEEGARVVGALIATWEEQT